mgnify:CR=1 FL=1
MACKWLPSMHPPNHPCRPHTCQRGSRHMSQETMLVHTYPNRTKSTTPIQSVHLCFLPSVRVNLHSSVIPSSRTAHIGPAFDWVVPNLTGSSCTCWLRCRTCQPHMPNTRCFLMSPDHVQSRKLGTPSSDEFPLMQSQSRIFCNSRRSLIDGMSPVEKLEVNKNGE